MLIGKRKFGTLSFLIGLPFLYLLIHHRQQVDVVKEAVVYFRFNDSNDLTTYDACTVDTCIDLLPCAVLDNRLTVYLEPLTKVLDEHGRKITPEPSREYLNLRSIISKSKYSVTNMDDACLIVPGFDTLNLQRFPYPMALRYAVDASNRFGNRTLLLFVFAGLQVPAGKALVARSQTFDSSFRHNYDVAIPLFFGGIAVESSSSRTVSSCFLVVFLQGIALDKRGQIIQIFAIKPDVLILEKCYGSESTFCDLSNQHYALADVLRECTFVVIFDKTAAFEWILLESLHCSSIPVIISDQVFLPFDDVIEWNRLSFNFYFERLNDVYAMLKEVRQDDLVRLKKQGQMIYKNYFSSLDQIVSTTLRILQDRLIPNSITFESEWNEKILPSRFFLPRIAPPKGFTAVVLSRGQMESLFRWLRVLDTVPSLAATVIVWPFERSSLLAGLEWPIFDRKIHVIYMKKFQSSNRYIVFPEIDTESIFSLFDESAVLAAEKIEFGYQLWRENPNRLVAFSTESNASYSTNQSASAYLKWTNLNVHLHGGLFYHGYYGVLYHKLFSKYAEAIIKKISRCEDIAMVYFVHQFNAIIIVETRLKKGYCPGELVFHRCFNESGIFWNKNAVVERLGCLTKLQTVFSKASYAQPVYFISDNAG